MAGHYPFDNLALPCGFKYSHDFHRHPSFHIGMIAVRALSPSTIRPPLARYSHGFVVPANHRLIITAGQLGIDLEDKVPPDSEGQAEICFANIAAILAEDGMTMANVIRLSVYVTAREHMEGYRRARDRRFPGTPPTTTLIMVAGLVRPEFLIEIEAIAAAAP
jgi:2-iminobutanoate/2-iminopropanoate deaminase